MEKKKTQGSFGMPKDVLDAVNKSKAKAAGVEPEETQESEVYDSESIPEVKEDGPKSEQKSEDPTPKELAAKIEKDLGITINEDDVWSFLFKGSMQKKNIVIIPNMMHATFRTITMKQTEEIDEKLAEALERKLMESGFRNFQTKLLLSTGIIELGKPGALKPLGEKSIEAVEAMPSLLVEKLSKKWNSFVYLVNYTINQYQEGEDGKKS